MENGISVILKSGEELDLMKEGNIIQVFNKDGRVMDISIESEDGLFGIDLYVDSYRDLTSEIIEKIPVDFTKI